MTFIDKCLRGEATPGEIDDYIDAWHSDPGSCKLYEYLGLTEEEYGSWVIDPSSLPAILAKKQG